MKEAAEQKAGEEAKETPAPPQEVAKEPEPLELTELGGAIGQWAYSPTSLYNTPIPEKPELSQYSKTDVEYLASGCNPVSSCLEIEEYGYPAYFARESTPKVKVEVDGSRCDEQTVEVPIPTGAQEEQVSKTIEGRDSPFVVFGFEGIEYDGYHMTEPGVKPDGHACTTTANWQAEGISPPSYGTTYWKTVPGHEASNGEYGGFHADENAYGAGLITYKDLDLPYPDPWPHAIGMAAGFTCGEVRWHDPYNWCKPPKPAHEQTTGACREASKVLWSGHDEEELCMPEGARLQLTPPAEGGPNCETTPLLTEDWQRQYCRTLQVYGIVLDDTGGNPISPAMRAIPQAAQSYPAGFVSPFAACTAQANATGSGRPERLCYQNAGGADSAALPPQIMEQMRVLKWQ